MSIILKQILLNNEDLKTRPIQRILILYENRYFFIGDTVCGFSWIPSLRTFFKNPVVDINCIRHYTPCDSIFRNNPHLNNWTNADWNELDYNAYDLLIVITDNEEGLLKILENKYKEPGSQTCQFCAVSLRIKDLLMDDEIRIFPFFTELFRFLKNNNEEGNLLYISKDERQWADDWLFRNGLNDNEYLIVLLDSSSNREKTVRINVFFEYLSYFLGFRNVKVLIFDEKKLGKKEFYAEFLDSGQLEKIIFAEGLTLRNAISLLTSKYIKLLFGPSTGLMHCASGIYKFLLLEGMPEEEMPVMITYVGYDTTQDYQHNEWDWWGNSLVDCILIKKDKTGDKKVMYLTCDNQIDYLPCKEFTSQMLIRFIEANYAAKINCLERAKLV